MSVTPLHLQIAIHYHISPEQWPMLHVPIHRQYADDLADAGLLRPRTGLAMGCYEKTDGLAVWVEAICSTPFPVKQWVMPAGRAARGREVLAALGTGEVEE